MRAEWLWKLLPAGAREAVGGKIEAISFTMAARFYKTARLILAPNQEIVDRLTRQTGKPGRLMLHGVDAEMFSPGTLHDGTLTLGYAGRLTAEKNVQFLAELADRLPPDLLARVQFLIVGDGSQRAWLQRRLPVSTVFTGMLRAEALARAYAQMDVFLFPSLSDTFGLVVLEAMATGVPVVSFQVTGPKSVVESGLNGFAAREKAEFVEGVRKLASDEDLRVRLGAGARATAMKHNWEAVFSSVYDGYATLLPQTERVLVSTGVA